MATPSWTEVARFIRFAVYSFVTFGSLVGAWIGLDLPRVASQTYVDSKFQVASESNREVKSQVLSTRLAINKMTRQNLEAEQYRLTQQAKNDSSFEIQKRLRDISEELIDTADERKRLLGPGN